MSEKGAPLAGSSGTSAFPVSVWAARCVPGLHAWSLTVLLPVLGCRSWGLFVVALLGVASLLIGSLVSLWRALPGRILGIGGFVTGCLAVWGGLGGGLSSLETPWGYWALGAVGWMLFPLGWGEPPRGAVSPAAPEDVGRPLLRARVRPSTWGAASFVVAILLALAMAALAWGDPRRPQALVPHLVATLLALSLLGLSVRVTLLRQGHGPIPLAGGGARSIGAGFALLAAGVLGVLGVQRALGHRDKTALLAWLGAAALLGLGHLATARVRRSQAAPVAAGAKKSGK